MPRAAAEPNASAWTEWSMTSSTGWSGLIFVASPPSAAMASRIAARSTTHGTPVKSCRMTRAGVKLISLLGSAFASQFASAYIGGENRLVVLAAEQVFKQDSKGVGESLEVVSLFLKCLEGVDGVIFPAVGERFL